MRRVKVYFDGGCRPNPGPIEVAVVIRGKPVIFTDLGSGSNGDAEWLALIRAVEQVLRNPVPGGLAGVDLVGDSLAVILAAREALARGAVAGSHAAAFLAALGDGGRPRLRWIRRQQNLAGIALARRHPR